MRRIAKSVAKLVVVLSAVSLTAGCAIFRGNDDVPAYRERPVESLYGFAGDLLDAGLFPDAITYFREVERQHPYSEWASRSIIMGAYASYRMGNYPEATAEAERYIGLYPGKPGAAYAYYLRGICFYEQIVDVGRDQGATQQAQEALRAVVSRYPNTDYAADARSKLARVDDHLAGKEMTVGRFYLRKGDTVAALNRFKTVVDRYQTTSHTPEALYRLVEADLTLGLREEALRNAAILGTNFPGSAWYADAYALMNAQGASAGLPRSTGTRRLRNLFGILPDRERPLEKDPQNTLRPPAE